MTDEELTEMIEEVRGGFCGARACGVCAPLPSPVSSPPPLQADRDGDGEISLDDFLKLMSRVK